MAKILKSSDHLKTDTISKSSTRAFRRCERELKRPPYAKVMTGQSSGPTGKKSK
jgi:hypothetical protein